MSNNLTMFPFRKGKPDKFGFTPMYRRAQCSKCLTTTSYVDTTKSGATDHIVALNLRKRKWIIDEQGEQHVCTKCQGLPVTLGRRYSYMKPPKTEVPTMFFKPKAKTQEVPTGDVVTPTPVEAEVSSIVHPTPAELRMIRKLLDDVYELKGQCYRADYSDRAIALIANVAEEWVTIERELAYGPAGDPESETEAQVRMLNELVDQARHHAEEAEAALQLVEEKVNAIKKKLAS